MSEKADLIEVVVDEAAGLVEEVLRDLFQAAEDFEKFAERLKVTLDAGTLLGLLREKFQDPDPSYRKRFGARISARAKAHRILTQAKEQEKAAPLPPSPKIVSQKSGKRKTKASKKRATHKPGPKSPQQWRDISYAMKVLIRRNAGRGETLTVRELSEALGVSINFSRYWLKAAVAEGACALARSPARAWRVSSTKHYQIVSAEKAIDLIDRGLTLRELQRIAKGEVLPRAEAVGTKEAPAKTPTKTSKPIPSPKWKKSRSKVSLRELRKSRDWSIAAICSKLDITTEEYLRHNCDRRIPEDGKIQDKILPLILAHCPKSEQELWVEEMARVRAVAMSSEEAPNSNS